MSPRHDWRFAAETRIAPAGDGVPKIEGYAAVFDSDSVDLGGFVERIAPGAFKRSISSSDAMIHAFWNHDSAIPLGSTRSGKLALAEDGKGLHFKLDTARLTPPQLDAIADGDMRMSFGFSVPKGGDTWEERGGSVLRTLNDVTLLEVSPVSMPAYPATSVALRSLDGWQKDADTFDPKLKQAILQMNLRFFLTSRRIAK